MPAKSCIIIVLVFLQLGGFGCKENPSSANNPAAGLQLADIGVTEAWIQVSSVKPNGPKDLTLDQGGKIRVKTQFFGPDTIIYIDSLLPKQTYVYGATVSAAYAFLCDSSSLAITTLDTTSHEFRWEIDTLADGLSSRIRDVAIVNDTCIWAVGEFRFKDATGQYVPDYNALRWDGARWNRYRVPFILDVGTSVFEDSLVPISAVFAVSQSDVWFSNGAVTRLLNNSWMEMDFLLSDGPGRPNKIWGNSASEMYFVGPGGAITRWWGSHWQKLNSGTDVDLLDVSGSSDGSVVWACGWEDFKPTVLLRLEPNVTSQWEKVWEESNPFTSRQDSLSGALTSVWTPFARRLYVLSWYGLYSCPSSTRGEGRLSTFSPGALPGFPYRLRGTGVNDCTLAGDYFMLAHFNGVTWRFYSQFFGGKVTLSSIDQRGRTLAAVGTLLDPINSRGLVVRGRR